LVDLHTTMASPIGCEVIDVASQSRSHLTSLCMHSW